MTQALYAHMNNKTIKRKRKKENKNYERKTKKKNKNNLIDRHPSLNKD
jgi:hypothetical protein